MLMPPAAPCCAGRATGRTAGGSGGRGVHDEELPLRHCPRRLAAQAGGQDAAGCALEKVLGEYLLCFAFAHTPWMPHHPTGPCPGGAAITMHHHTPRHINTCSSLQHAVARAPTRHSEERHENVCAQTLHTSAHCQLCLGRQARASCARTQSLLVSTACVLGATQRVQTPNRQLKTANLP